MEQHPTVGLHRTVFFSFKRFVPKRFQSLPYIMSVFLKEVEGSFLDFDFWAPAIWNLGITNIKNICKVCMEWNKPTKLKIMSHIFLSTWLRVRNLINLQLAECVHFPSPNTFQGTMSCVPAIFCKIAICGYNLTLWSLFYTDRKNWKKNQPD